MIGGQKISSKFKLNLWKKIKIKILFIQIYFYFTIKKNITKIFSKKQLYNGLITQELLDNFKMPILTTMIRKKIFLKNRFDEKYNIIGDFDLFIRISLKEKIFSIQKPLAYYRVHDANMTKNKFKYSRA